MNGHPVEAWEPATRESQTAILLFHDLDGVHPSQRPDWRSLIEAAPVPIVCPLSGRSWWLGQPSSDFPGGGSLGWVAGSVVDWIRDQWQITPPSIGIIGVGMGGNGALNLSYRHARRFPVVAVISAAVDFHLYQPSEPVLQEVFGSVEAARQETATLHLHPLNWPLSQRIACHPSDPYWFDGCERLASKLTSSGIPFDSHLQSSRQFDRQIYDQQELQVSIDYVVRNLPLAVAQLS